MSQLFQRSELVLGADKMDRLGHLRVILFGVGGVGSWCAEALVRSGVGHLTIVDGDVVAESNINRQLPATTHTLGQAKVAVLRERLLQINPQADITALQAVYTEQTAGDFRLEDYDVVLDCIDSLRDKTALILHATSLPQVRFYASMGAALKCDPTRVRVAEFWKVQGCALARALRLRMKHDKRFPARKFRCVYSDEQLPNLTESDDQESGKRINGSLVYVTAVFGFMLAAQVINES